MKNSLSYLCILFVFFCAFSSGYSAEPELKNASEIRLFNKLKRLPAGATSYHTVEAQLLKLVSIDPENSARYVFVGIRRLSIDRNLITHLNKIKRKVTDNLKHDDLSEMEFLLISKSVIKEIDKFKMIMTGGDVF